MFSISGIRWGKGIWGTEQRSDHRGRCNMKLCSGTQEGCWGRSRVAHQRTPGLAADRGQQAQCPLYSAALSPRQADPNIWGERTCSVPKQHWCKHNAQAEGRVSPEPCSREEVVVQ